MCCIRHLQDPVYYRKLRHSGIFTPYSDIYSVFRTLCNSCIFRSLPYSEYWHIEPKIYSKSRHLLAYVCCLLLAYWKPCHILNFCLFRIMAYLGSEAYSEACLFRYIQVYLGIFNSDSYDKTNFLFFTLFLHSFQQNFQTYVFWLEWRQFQYSFESSEIICDLWK